MGSLKGRTTIFVAVALVVLALGLNWLAFERERMSDRYYQETIYRDQIRIWEYIQEAALGQLRAQAERLVENKGLISAVKHHDRIQTALIMNGLRPVFNEAGITLAEIVDDEGGLIYSSQTADRSDRPILDGWTLTELLNDGDPVGGVRLGRDGKPLLMEALALPLDQGQYGAVLVGRPIAALFSGERRQLFGGEYATASNAGVIGDSSNDRLWAALTSLIELNLKRQQILDIRERHWAVTPIPLVDVAGGRLGYLLMANDVTDSEGRRRLMVEITAFAGLGFGVVVLVLLYTWLLRAFAPLDKAVTVIDGLSHGETGFWLRASGDNEVGRLARSIEVFRANTLDLIKVRASRIRRRRRQERFIRQQMLALANTLDDDARDAVLHDLDDIEKTERAASGGEVIAEVGDSSDFGMLAQAFRHMAQRVGAQQSSLSAMVRELREALEHKTRLAALEQELDISRKIQMSALPKPFPPHPLVEVAGSMRAAKEVGGDFFDYFLIDDNRLAVIVADVSGKGVPAAFFMLITRTLLRAIAQSNATPAEALRRLNDILAEDNDEMMFVTLFFGILHLDDGRMIYANAGHNPPMIRRLSGQIAVLPIANGMALAVMPGNDMTDAEIALSIGDAFVAFTDGVTEAHDPVGALYGEARLEAVLRRTSGNADEMLAAVNDSVDRFAQGAAQSDDITVLAIRYLGGEPKT